MRFFETRGIIRMEPSSTRTSLHCDTLAPPSVSSAYFAWPFANEIKPHAFYHLMIVRIKYQFGHRQMGKLMRAKSGERSPR